MASEVVRKQSASLVEFLNINSFWRLFGLNLKQKVIIWTNIVCAECTDKYFDEYLNFQKVLLIWSVSSSCFKQECVQTLHYMNWKGRPVQNCTPLSVENVYSIYPKASF